MSVSALEVGDRRDARSFDKPTRTFLEVHCGMLAWTTVTPLGPLKVEEQAWPHSALPATPSRMRAARTAHRTQGRAIANGPKPLKYVLTRLLGARLAT